MRRRFKSGCRHNSYCCGHAHCTKLKTSSHVQRLSRRAIKAAAAARCTTRHNPPQLGTRLQAHS